MMILRKISQDKRNWQDKTIEKIKQNLNLYSTDNTQSTVRDEKLVVMYGNSQIGKTTVILTLIGIDDAHIKKVNEVLRAKRPKGQSSTSTTILYKQSKNDNFGLSFVKSIHSEENKIDYFSDKEFEKQLQIVRDKVEKNANDKSIMCVSIPKKYFKKDESFLDIIILDLPGDESGDLKEQEHVKVLLKLYLSLSSVNIIVVRANNIQSELEHLGKTSQGEFLDHNWNVMPTRYMVLTTHSYSEESIKSYFKKPRDERKESFYEYVCNNTKKDYRSISGFDDSDVEVYPLDVGDSFNTFKDELKDEDDRQELIDTRDKIIKELLDSIRKRQSNSLHTIIQSLRESINFSYKKLNTDLLDKENNEKEKTKVIPKDSDKIEITRKEYEKNIERLEKYNSEISQNFSAGFNAWQSFEIEMIEFLENYTDNHKDFKKKEILNKFNELVEEMLNKTIDKYKEYIKIFYKYGFVKNNESYFLELKRKDWETNYVYEIENYIYEQGKLFHWHNRPNLDKIKNYFNKHQFFYKIYNELLNELTSKHNGDIQAERRKVNFEIIKSKKYLKKCDGRKENKEYEKSEAESELSKIRDEKQELNRKKEADEKLLNSYLDIAKKTYEEGRKAIFSEINSYEVPLEEKLEKVLSLGLSNLDYKKLRS